MPLKSIIAITLLILILGYWIGRRLKLWKAPVVRPMCRKNDIPPLSVTPFAQGEAKTFTAFLCDGYLIKGMRSLPDLIAILKEKTAAHPGMRLLATLDDFGQASYTSGHAIERHDLDDAQGYDLSGLDPAAFEDGVHRGYLSTRSEFFIRNGNLKKASDTTVVPAAQLGWPRDGEDFKGLQAAPDVLDAREIWVQVVPVAHAYETVSAFPNGYFSGDLTPMELWAIAKRFETEWGYALFGIGASYVGFLKTRPLTEEETARFAAAVVALFSSPAMDAARQVADVVATSDFLLLAYGDR